MISDTDRMHFASPPPEYRPAPFWFWNDRLDAARLVEQFDLLTGAGMGGAVLHARGGLSADEYLDETWFACIAAVLDRARETGCKVWIYDELGWPSGTAGGRVTAKNPELRAMRLLMHDITVSENSRESMETREIVAAYRVTRTDPQHGILRRKDRGTPLPGAVSLLPDCIRYERIVEPFAWDRLTGERVLLFELRRDGGSINYLDRRGAEAFLESTHEEYHKRFADDFGATLTHTFMDEAGMLIGPSSLPWREGFDSLYTDRRGYDLLNVLPDLFFETPGHERTRFHFWSFAAELLREGFGIPMNEWCSEHSIHYTGHYVFETTLKEATRQLGSTMPLYEHQGMPGIDVLGGDFYSRRFAPEDFGFYSVMIKQAASVAHQLGKPGLMSESYGVGGHACGPEAMQTVANWQMALGVTFIIQHAPFYSIRGRRKFDHPPIIGWQQPYWRFVNKHMDAISRTGWALSQGTHRSDVLLLHPQASMQATYRHSRTSEERKAENYVFDADMPFEMIDKHITLITTSFLDAQIDFDFGDEELMAVHGNIEHSHLRIGEMTYRIVVLPPSVNIRSSTVALLKQFISAGGQVIVAGSAPRLVDGEPNDSARWLFDEHATRINDGIDYFDYTDLIAAITERGGRTVMAKTPEGEDVPQLKVQRRTWNGREILYLANISRDTVQATISCDLGIDGTVEEWNTSTGSIASYAACSENEPFAADLQWHPRQARLFVAVPGTSDAPCSIKLTGEKRISLDWSGKRTGPNTLLMDTCTVKIGDTQVLSSIKGAQGLIREHMQHGNLQPVRTQFDIRISEESPVRGTVQLACEHGTDPHVQVNGTDVPVRTVGHVLDPAIQLIDLPVMQSGGNVLTIEARYDDPEALQAPWLSGEFALKSQDNVTFTLEASDGIVEIGSWPERGLQFYAGTVVYTSTLNGVGASANDRFVLHMPGLRGSAQVRVNGAVVDHVLWPPYECDITDHLTGGTGTIEIEVANTLRNLLGAHYNYDEAEQPGISIASYSGEPNQSKQFMDYGLLSAPEIVVRRVS